MTAREYDLLETTAEGRNYTRDVVAMSATIAEARTLLPERPQGDPPEMLLRSLAVQPRSGRRRAHVFSHREANEPFIWILDRIFDNITFHSVAFFDEWHAEITCYATSHLSFYLGCPGVPSVTYFCNAVDMEVPMAALHYVQVVVKIEPDHIPKGTRFIVLDASVEFFAHALRRTMMHATMHYANGIFIAGTAGCHIPTDDGPNPDGSLLILGG
jgi:hypothetical protein